MLNQHSEEYLRVGGQDCRHHLGQLANRLERHHRRSLVDDGLVKLDMSGDTIDKIAP
jgi:hypothetical protein